MAESIDDIISQFEAKLKQVTPTEVPLAKGDVTVEEVTGGGETCVTKRFKELVDVLPQKYIGTEFKDFLMEFLNGMPECEV